MTRFFHIFFSAIVFFSKIPIPKSVDFNKVKQGEATLFLPVVGWIVGGISALSFLLALYIFPISLAVLIAVISSIYITSAFHEDGLADMFDGFGGGWTKEKILEIMKDSSIGTYGVLALIVTLTLKYSSLLYLPVELIPIALIAGHSFSRALAVSLMFDLDYARIENSKAKSFTKKLTSLEMILIVLLGILPMFLLNNHYIFLCVIPLGLVRVFLVKFLKKWIGGYTGDCIGAAQQIFEVVFLMAVLAIYNSNLVRSFI